MAAVRVLNEAEAAFTEPPPRQDCNQINIKCSQTPDSKYTMRGSQSTAESMASVGLMQ